LSLCPDRSPRRQRGSGERSSRESGPEHRSLVPFQRFGNGPGTDSFPLRGIAQRILPFHRKRQSGGNSPAYPAFYDNLYRTETRVLYENGKEIRRQWNFRDSQDLARLTASGTAGLFGKASSADEKKSGFIELRDAGGLITREFQFAEDLSETDIRYFYTGSRLTKVETWFKAAPPAPDSSGSNAAPVAADSSGSSAGPAVTDSGGSNAAPVAADSSGSSAAPVAADSSGSSAGPAVTDNGGNNAAPVAADSSGSSAAPVAADSSGSSAAPAVTDSGGSGAAPVAADSSGSSAAPVAADSGGSSAAPVFVQMYTDYYNYTRSGSLRAIDRTLLQGDAGAKLSRISFPRLGLDFSSGNVMVSQGAGTSSEFLTDVNTPEGTQITYTLDSRGRILTEVWKDKDGGQIGVFTNTWSGDRLQSVLWKSDDDERLVEYDYDSDGNRSAERDFRQGVLERSVISQGNKDTENIYMNGKLILRAHWENGMKISEERIYSPGAKQ